MRLGLPLAYTTNPSYDRKYRNILIARLGTETDPEITIR